LGDAYSQSGRHKQTDATEKTKRLDTAVTDFQKAIDFKKAENPEGKLVREKTGMQPAQADANKEAGRLLQTDWAMPTPSLGNTDGGKFAAYTFRPAQDRIAKWGNVFPANLGAALTRRQQDRRSNDGPSRAVDAFDKAPRC
jgi:hypothetical protein